MRAALATLLVLLALGVSCGRTSDGTKSPAERGTPTPHVTVDLPALASGAVRIEDARSRVAVGFAVLGADRTQVKRDGARAHYVEALGEGVDLTYELRDDGVEDSIRFAHKPAREATVYQVDVRGVAGLRLVSNVLEFLDASGAPRLRMGAPFVVDARGAKSPATVSVPSCKVDTDPRGPWGRPVLAPGAESCDVLVSWEGLGAVYPLTVDPAWTVTGALSVQHGGHQVATLPSKRVLIVGGIWGANVTEIFDPVTETWAIGANTNEGRGAAGSAVLDSGKVLLAGGAGRPPLATSELYDEATGKWSPGPSMTVGHQEMATVKLRNGKVLVAGGAGVATADLYDPQMGTWSAAGTMTSVRWQPILSALPDGTALVAGGGPASGPALDSAEIFSEPATWTLTQPLPGGRVRHVSTALADGRVLVMAGSAPDGSLYDTAVTFDPNTKAWSPAGTFSIARTWPAPVLLADGRVLMAGGDSSDDLSSAELYDPRTNAWTSAGDMNYRRFSHVATLLSTGKVLITGPRGNFPELFQPQAPGRSCFADGECAAGFCVDGICCDSACGAPCMACTAAKKGGGIDGVCGPVAVGLPHPDCPTLPASTCGATGLCDGRGACALQASGTACGAAVCEGHVSSVAECDGRGACKKLVTPCAPYTCASSTSCGHGPCTSDSDCADAYWCNSKRECAQAACDGDHTIVAPDRSRQDCAPYRCDAVECTTSCRSSTDCVEPAVCNGDHRCVPVDEARRAEDERGWLCAAAPGAERSGSWGRATLLVLVLVARRRRPRPRVTRPAVAPG